MKSKTKNLMILIAIGLIFPLILSSDFSSTDILEVDVDIPKQSGGYTEPFIHIDASNPNNWTWTAGNYSWCYFDNGYYIIENVTIDASSSPTGSGIYIENSTDEYFIIRNCTIYNADNSFFDSGIWLENTSNGTLIYNNCSGNRQGIYLSNCEANNIIENTVNNNEYNGIYLETNCDHNNITGNMAESNLYGIQIAIDCDYNSITLNTANKNNDYGIYINSFGTSCENNVILNNTANKNNRYGIYLRYTNNENSIINNSLNDNTETGIYLVNTHIFNVTGNTIYNSKRGIDVSLCDTSNITGNTIISNLELGIYLYHSDSIIIKNNIINRNDLGIRLDGSDYNNITGNILKDNNWCIYETYGEGNVIENNDCTSPTTELPIYIDDYATGVGAHNWTWAESQTWCSGTGTFWDPYIIENLTISGFGSEKYGIDIRNSNVSFIIQKCLIYNSDEAGIYLDNVNNSRLINNNCSNNDNGLYIEYSNNITIFENIANDNYYEGIYVYGCNYINITGNNVNDNNNGISINTCKFSYIIENIGNRNSESAIYLDESDFNSIIGNLACNNTDNGIELIYSSYNNTILGNTICNSSDGISLDECEDNSISGNILRNNNFGMYISSNCYNNSIFKNYFLENGNHAFDEGTDNKWNSTLIGNYWDNHTEPDVNPQDGIVDTPYNYIGGAAGSIDYLPIAEDGEPKITIHSPNAGSTFGSTAPTLIIEVIDSTPVEMWYTLDGGLHNYTFYYIQIHTFTYTRFAGVVDRSAWEALPDGNVIIMFYAIDIAGNEAFEEVSVIKDMGLDPGIIAVIVVVSIIGGVALISVIFFILIKKDIISLEKIKGFSLKRK